MKLKQKQADGSFVEVEVDPIEAIKGAISEGVKPLEDSIKSLETKIGETDTSAKAIDARLKKIEALPALTKRETAAMGSSDRYKGYRIDNQMREIRHFASKNPDKFQVFSEPEKADEYVKFMIDLSRALTSKNPADHADYHKRLAEYVEKSGDPIVKAAYAEGAGSTGGYLVPTEYLWDMIQLARSRTFALDYCRIVPMGTNVLVLPSEASLPTVAWTAEAVAATESEGTFGQITLTAKRLDAFSVVSNEQLADSAMDLVGILTEQFGYAQALELDNQVLNGTGAPFSGVLGAACGNSVVLAATSTNFSAQIADNYANAIFQLNEADAANAKWIINRISKFYLRTLKDTQGRPIFAPPGSATPGTIYEIPYVVSEKMTNTSAVSTGFAVLGDWKKMLIGRRLGFGSLDVDPYGLFTASQTRFRLASRWAFSFGRASAFCRIITAAS